MERNGRIRVSVCLIPRLQVPHKIVSSESGVHGPYVPPLVTVVSKPDTVLLPSSQNMVVPPAMETLRRLRDAIQRFVLLPPKKDQPLWIASGPNGTLGVLVRLVVVVVKRSDNDRLPKWPTKSALPVTINPPWKSPNVTPIHVIPQTAFGMNGVIGVHVRAQVSPNAIVVSPSINPESGSHVRGIRS